MKRILFIAILFLSALSMSAQQTSHLEDNSSIPVASGYYWTGPEGNLGLEITGKFQSEQKLEATLSLLKELGSFKDKKYPFNEKTWSLRDILVSVDFNATGSVAKWQVSGPKPLILSYLDSLQRQHQDKSLFYDFGCKVINWKPSTD